MFSNHQRFNAIHNLAIIFLGIFKSIGLHWFPGGQNGAHYLRQKIVLKDGPAFFICNITNILRAEELIISLLFNINNNILELKVSIWRQIQIKDRISLNILQLIHGCSFIEFDFRKTKYFYALSSVFSDIFILFAVIFRVD